MGTKALRHRWQIFADHLLTGHSATDAYIQAGYKTTTRRSAEAAASRLRKHPDVAAYLQHRHALAREETLQRILLAHRQRRGIVESTPLETEIYSEINS